jgi:hypothetical protein
MTLHKAAYCLGILTSFPLELRVWRLQAKTRSKWHGRLESSDRYFSIKIWQRPKSMTTTTKQQNSQFYLWPTTQTPKIHLSRNSFTSYCHRDDCYQYRKKGSFIGKLLQELFGEESKWRSDEMTYRSRGRSLIEVVLVSVVLLKSCRAYSSSQWFFIMSLTYVVLGPYFNRQFALWSFWWGSSRFFVLATIFVRNEHKNDNDNGG